ncbi:TlpA disulfide reductase family protein [Nonomuraea rhodomycinica]|uniref:TlpA family protein disulfide reductase n=1 Tax=Nonomuraea rhodomycinica TaxID=1712872 RepID=A0A7Y6IUI6_9ACTN|nr:TlpA disulfide reductase family protein [Nonomuraea rhodomycinica]NUW44346.1 TlpA family protein disulfide reductase [Nonomuraea rhodomycinica]
MPYLVVAVALVGVLCLLNLLLLFGVIRRLREQSSMLEPPSLTLPVGGAVGDFSAVTTTRETVSMDSLGDGTLVGFFSSTCQPCHEKLPEFVAFAETTAARSLAVVATAPDEGAEMISALESVADVVVVESLGSPVAKAFDVRGTPAFVTVERGKVSATGLPASHLRA